MAVFDQFVIAFQAQMGRSWTAIKQNFVAMGAELGKALKPSIPQLDAVRKAQVDTSKAVKNLTKVEKVAGRATATRAAANKKAASQIQYQNTLIDKNRRAQAGAAKAMSTLGDKRLILSMASKRLASDQEKLSKSDKKYSGLIKAAEGRFKSRQQAIDASRASIKKLEDRVKSHAKVEEKAGAVIQKHRETVTKAVEAQREAYGEIAGDALLAAKVGSVAFVAMTSAITVLTLAGGALQWQMAEVGSMLESQMIPQLGHLERRVLEVGEAFGYASEIAAKALYQILSAQIEVAHASYVLETSARAARAGFVDMETAADALTTIMNAYGLTAAEASRISDLLFATVRKGKTTFAELAAQIGRVAAQGALAGISMEDLFSAIAVMTQAGIKSSVAMTSMTAILRNVLSPSAEASEIAFMKFGISLGSVGLEASGLVGIMKALENATASEIRTIFASQRAFRGAAALIQNITGYTKTYRYMLEATGTTADALNEVQKAMTAQLKRLVVAATNAVKSFGMAFAESDLLRGVLKGLTAVLKGLGTALSDTEKNLGGVFIRTALVGAAVSALVYTVIKAGVAFWAFAKSIWAGVAALKAAQVAATGAISAIGLIAIALGIVAATVSALLDLWDSHSEALERNIKTMGAANAEWQETIGAAERTIVQLRKLIEENRRLGEMETKRLEVRNAFAKLGIALLENELRTLQDIKAAREYLSRIEEEAAKDSIKNLENQAQLARETYEAWIGEVEALSKAQRDAAKWARHDLLEAVKVKGYEEPMKRIWDLADDHVRRLEAGAVVREKERKVLEDLIQAEWGRRRLNLDQYRDLEAMLHISEVSRDYLDDFVVAREKELEARRKTLSLEAQLAVLREKQAKSGEKAIDAANLYREHIGSVAKWVKMTQDGTWKTVPAFEAVAEQAQIALGWRVRDLELTKDLSDQAKILAARERDQYKTLSLTYEQNNLIAETMDRRREINEDMIKANELGLEGMVRRYEEYLRLLDEVLGVRKGDLWLTQRAKSTQKDINALEAQISGLQSRQSIQEEIVDLLENAGRFTEKEAAVVKAVAMERTAELKAVKELEKTQKEISRLETLRSLRTKEFTPEMKEQLANYKRMLPFLRYMVKLQRELGFEAFIGDIKDAASEYGAAYRDLAQAFRPGFLGGPLSVEFTSTDDKKNRMANERSEDYLGTFVKTLMPDSIKLLRDIHTKIGTWS